MLRDVMGREWSIWSAYEIEGNPRKLRDPLLPGFSLSNVAFLTSKKQRPHGCHLVMDLT